MQSHRKWKAFFSTPRQPLRTAPKLTCSYTFHLRQPTVSLQYTFSFSKKHRSCVCTAVTLSHRFKAFSPAFCGQNRLRHEPPKISAKSLPAELWIVPGVQRFANLWCTFGSFRTREKHEKRSHCREHRGSANLESAHRNGSFAPQQLKPFKEASRFCKPRTSPPQPELRTATIKTFLWKLRGFANLETAH